MIVFHPRTSETKRASEKKDHPRTTFRRDKANVIDSNSKTPPSKFPKLRIRILEGFDKVSQAFPASKTQNLVIFLRSEEIREKGLCEGSIEPFWKTNLKFGKHFSPIRALNIFNLFLNCTYRKHGEAQCS